MENEIKGKNTERERERERERDYEKVISNSFDHRP
jgi:hypothetical protein